MELFGATGASAFAIGVGAIALFAAGLLIEAAAKALWRSLSAGRLSERVERIEARLAPWREDPRLIKAAAVVDAEVWSPEPDTLKVILDETPGVRGGLFRKRDTFELAGRLSSVMNSNAEISRDVAQQILTAIDNGNLEMPRHRAAISSSLKKQMPSLETKIWRRHALSLAGQSMPDEETTMMARGFSHAHQLQRKLAALKTTPSAQDFADLLGECLAVLQSRPANGLESYHQDAA